MWRWTSVAACGLLLTISTSSSVGTASAATSDEPVRVEGTASPDGAPLLTAEPGWYATDGPGSADTLYYQVERSAPESDVWVGLFSRPDDHYDDAWLGIELSTLDGTECDADTTWSTNEDEPRSLLDAAVSDTAAKPDDDAAKECAEADQFIVTLSQRESGNDDYAGTTVELAVNEEPRATNADELSAVSENAEWTPLSSSQRTDITGAPHPFEAEALEPGSYETTLASGEQRFFRVDLDWGQRLQAHVRVPRPPKAAREPIEQLDGEPMVVGQLLNPTFGNPRIRGDAVDDEFNHADLSPTESSELRVHTNPVRYLNRSVEEPPYNRKAASPGPYYLVVTLPDSEQKFELPIHMELETRGQPDDPPEYAADAEAVGPGWADRDEAPPSATWFIGGGLLLFLVGVAAVIASRLRRPERSDSVPAEEGSQS